MNRLNEKIVEILKQHPEGEPFFNALDAMIRGDLDVLNTFMGFVKERLESKDCTLILTGQFGNVMMSLFGPQLYNGFNDIILVNGGIRTGNKPVIFKNSLKATKCILLDDSFYSGKTRDDIESALKLIDSRAYIAKTFVIYDGSKNKKSNVFSMFRYYDNPSIPVWSEDNDEFNGNI